jgi:uncharacterized protein (DUF2384 family)
MSVNDKQEIAELAVEIFGNQEKAEAWLTKPRKLFKYQSALEFIEKEDGLERVKEVLYQIDSGYSA